MLKRLSRSLGIVVAGFASSVATAQPQPAPTCQEEPEFRQFDFWLGE